MPETSLNRAKQFPPIVDIVYVVNPRYPVISKLYLLDQILKKFLEVFHPIRFPNNVAIDVHVRMLPVTAQPEGTVETESSLGGNYSFAGASIVLM